MLDIGDAIGCRCHDLPLSDDGDLKRRYALPLHLRLEECRQPVFRGLGMSRRCEQEDSRQYQLVHAMTPKEKARRHPRICGVLP